MVTTAATTETATSPSPSQPYDLIIRGLPDAIARVPHWGTGDPLWREKFFPWRDRVLAYRKNLHAALELDPGLRAEEKAACKAFGAEYLMTMYGTVWEPRIGQPMGQGYIPFVPMPHQIRVMQFYRERREAAARGEYGHGLITKPRKVGVTWAALGDSLHGFLFLEPWDEVLMSRKEDQVDRAGDKGTMFVKMDMLLKGLPEFLRPKGFKESRDRRRLVLLNPENGNQITGQATTSSSTRGERATQIKMDEASFWPDLLASFTTAIGTTDNAVVQSSESYEESRDFETIRLEMQEKNPEAVCVVEWWEHPAQDERWYQKERAKFESSGDLDAFEREVNRNPRAGFGHYIYPEAMDVRLDGKAIVAQQEVILTMDPGRDDDFAIVLFQERGGYNPMGEPPMIDLVWSYRTKGKDAKFIASLLVGEPQTGPNGYPYTDIDLEFAAICGRLRRVSYYGDPTGHNIGPTGESWWSAIDKSAQAITGGRTRIFVRTSSANKDRLLPGRRDAFRRLLRRMRCYDHERPREALQAFREHKYQARSRNRPGITEPWQGEHDWTSHLTTAGEYAAVHLEVAREIADLTRQQKRPAYASPHGKITSVRQLGTVPTLRR